jgi:alpha-mannosidase
MHGRPSSKIRLLAFVSSVFLVLQTASTGTPPGKIASDAQWLAGYGRSLAGETIRYHSSHPRANSALIVRADESARSMEWETAVVPDSLDSPRVTFAWLAGMATGKGSHSFKMAIDGREAFTLTTAADSSQKRREFLGPDGSTLVFQTAIADQFQELFGTMCLTVPASACRPGKPLTIRIQGQSAGSRDWIMTFEHQLQEGAAVEPEQALVRQAGSLFQPVRLELEHLGPSAAVEVSASGGSTLKARVEPGFNSYSLPVKAVTATSSQSFRLRLGDDPVSTIPLELKPVARRELYLLPHSHNDIGYSDLQVKVEKDQWRYLEEGLALARKTAGYPPEARFKWNVEILWPIESYLAQATESQRRDFVDAVRKGWVGLEGFLGGELTGLCPPEELVQLTEYGRRLVRQLGLPPITTAMISDIPGSSWSTVPALAQAGIKYFSSGPNYVPFLPDGGDRIGFTLKSWGDRPFYWVSPSGGQKVLFWMAGRGYSWFHGLNQGNLGSSSERPILDYARELADRGYPYDMVQVRYTVGGDNGPPDPALPDMVKAWNERYESPRLVIATSRQMFEEFERRHGASLPAFAGDMTPYWEDGAMSSAAETVATRTAVQRLLQAETLWAMRDPASFPSGDFEAAWRQALLFDEHTWGAANSISQPDNPEVKTQWDYKKSFALEADKASRVLLAKALAAGKNAAQPPGQAAGQAVAVYNTSSWPRTDLVILDAPLTKAGDRVTDERGTPVPSQRLSTGELAVLAQDIPAFGQRIYFVGKGSAFAPRSVDVSDHSLANDDLRLTVDRASGAISSLRWKARDVELADTASGYGLNDYVYLPGRDPGRALRNTQPRITVKEKGPLVVSLLIASEAPGARSLVREVRLVQGLDRLDLINTLDKLSVRDKESAHFAFPFLVPKGITRYDVGWGFVRPEADQLAGACKDFLSVQNAVDVSNQGYGLTWATPDAPLVEPGTITDETWNAGGTRSWKSTADRGSTLFSYVMNNYWHTNYKAGQEGPVTFRYSIKPHGIFNPAEAKRFSEERCQPLLASAAPASAEPLKPALEISPASIIATSLKPSLDGKALIVRLYNAGGYPVKAEVRVPGFEEAMIVLSSPAEETGERLTAPVVMPAYGVLTLRVERK